MTDTSGSPHSAGTAGGHHAPLWLVILVAGLAVSVVVAGVYAYRLSQSVGSRGSAVVGRVLVGEAKAGVAATNGSGQSHLQLAYAYQRSANYSLARREYGIVLKTDPRNTAAEFNLGMIDEIQGDPSSAAQHYRRVLEIDPGNDLAAKQMSVIQYANQDWKGLLATLQPAVRANPDMADLRFLLGVAYEKTNQRQKAIAQYKEALRLYPNMREAQSALARLR
jgi:tetratricopeptide (TPR) repeat protein